MKVGIRKPSIKKSISARTTGKAKRKLKRMVNPLYGKKGMGFIKNPTKSIKGKIYRKTTVSTKDASGCLVSCFVLTFQFIWLTILLMWYILKYIVIGLIWLIPIIINGCIAIIEWLINLRFKNDNADSTLIDANTNDISSTDDNQNSDDNPVTDDLQVINENNNLDNNIT